MYPNACKFIWRLLLVSLFVSLFVLLFVLLFILLFVIILFGLLFVLNCLFYCSFYCLWFLLSLFWNVCFIPLIMLVNNLRTVVRSVLCVFYKLKLEVLVPQLVFYSISGFQYESTKKCNHTELGKDLWGSNGYGHPKCKTVFKKKYHKVWIP